MPPRRVLIEKMSPEIDAGRHPIKRVRDDTVTVEVDLVADGHEAVAGRLLYRRRGERAWQDRALELLVNDRWTATFPVGAEGRCEYTVEGWVDRYGTWSRALQRRLEAGEDVAVELLVGAGLLQQAARRARGEDRKALGRAARRLADEGLPAAERAREAVDPLLGERARPYPDRRAVTRYERVLQVVVDPPLAACAAWYEFFPRSCGPDGRHGTFLDAVAMLDHVADMGFDVVYLPPIHPIGRTHRKGRDNSPRAREGDPGSPWAIGSEEGGHLDLHPELGTPEDFRTFVGEARDRGLEVALDIAFQCSPDHPWIREHPEWFGRRPDGSIQYAENPPKKYQDICPLDFTCRDWPALWEALYGVFEHWIAQGVTIFRVDNPHTKLLPFWEWCIGRLEEEHPGVILLSEAFTRPKLMYALAKMGFTQSYTYFTWRRTRRELEEYLTELTRTEVAEFFRPSFWPNTPDILPQELWGAPREAFAMRLVLAATLSSLYGVYGPAFELCENRGRPGSGEYADNEKYEIKSWDLRKSDSLRGLMKRLNRIRRENPALQRNDGLRFHRTDNDQLLAYSKSTPDGANTLLVVVDLDWWNRHTGWLELDLGALGLGDDETFQVHDLLGDARHLWRGRSQYVEIDPHVLPAHVFRIRRWATTEQDFDYFA